MFAEFKNAQSSPFGIPQCISIVMSSDKTPSVLPGWTGHIPGFRDARLEKSFSSALQSVRQTPLNRERPGTAPPVRSSPVRSFPWEKGDTVPVPGYTGHISSLHDLKLERTFGKAVQYAPHPSSPAQHQPKPDPPADPTRITRMIPGYTGFMPRQAEMDLGVTFAEGSQRARVQMAPQRATAPQRVGQSVAPPRPTTSVTMEGPPPGYSGHFPGKHELTLGRTYGAAHRESVAVYGEKAHHAPTKTDAYRSPSPRTPSVGPSHVSGYQGFVPDQAKPEKPFPQRTREVLARMAPPPGREEFRFRAPERSTAYYLGLSST